MGLTLAELSVEAFARGDHSTGPGPLPTDKAAAALLSGLFSPVALHWKAKIDNGLTATVRAEVSQDLTCWPPEWVHLTVTRGAEGVDDDLRQRCLEIKVPSSVLPSQLEKILAGASFTGSNCGAEEASTSSLSDECTSSAIPPVTRLLLRSTTLRTSAGAASDVLAHAWSPWLFAGWSYSLVQRCSCEPRYA